MIHVVGLPHTRFSEAEFSHCAFTTKAIRWVEMMGEVGEDITVYWGGDEPVNTAGVEQYVPVLSDFDQSARFGDDLPDKILDLDWNPDTAHWRQLNHRVAAELYTRWSEGDLVAVLSGSNHDGLAHEWQAATFIEPWVGYMGISKLTKAKAFESSAWRHSMYGRHYIEDGNPLDCVIPNFLRPEDFEVGEDRGYLLFIGRMTRRKNVEGVVEIARRCRMPLVMAGQGGTYDGNVVTGDGGALVIDAHDVEIDYRDVIRPEERRELLAHASATLCPTLYIEPFGTVHVEALMSGVMPVASDWGVFVETLPAQARVRDVSDGPAAVEYAIKNRGPGLRDAAIDRFSVNVCAKQYVEWLARIRASMAAA